MKTGEDLEARTISDHPSSAKSSKSDDAAANPYGMLLIFKVAMEEDEIVADSEFTSLHTGISLALMQGVWWMMSMADELPGKSQTVESCTIIFSKNFST
ncbi:hypothetical protein TorRG33x02_237120 [Trema orientale]|uniref:Uncharacterized protein n=1 Tax=Trema orientale TaxID=63057 RepID=A0A2P5E015_TREOI|nr:hypothetical protein TorRG33x02_237120 [Trema orientale]